MAVCCSSASVRSVVFACTSLNSRALLDRDHGLVGEGLQQPDMVLAERAGRPARHDDNADGPPSLISGANSMLR